MRNRRLRRLPTMREFHGRSAFSHSPAPLPGNSCHSGIRPSSTALLPAEPRLIYINNASALMDSLTAGVPWLFHPFGCSLAGGYFNHKNSTNVNVTNLFALPHQSNAQWTVGSPSFDHANGGTETVHCHKNPGVAWSGGQCRTLLRHLCHLSWYTKTLSHHAVAGRCHPRFISTLKPLMDWLIV